LTIETLQIQGSDSTTKDVVLDTVSGDSWPVYQLSTGTVIVSASNPFPVTQDEPSYLNSILKELKIMNLHLAILSDNLFDKADLDG